MIQRKSQHDRNLNSNNPSFHTISWCEQFTEDHPQTSQPLSHPMQTHHHHYHMGNPRWYRIQIWKVCALHRHQSCYYLPNANFENHYICII